MAFLARNPVAQLAMLALLGAPAQGSAQSLTADEYQVKAAFLYNFARFVEWPPARFKDPHDPIAICVFGQSPIIEAVEQAVKGKVVAERGFSLHQVWDAGPAGNCQILFFSGATERKRWRAVVTELRNAPVLTVGETDGFASEGGIVNFRLEDGRVRIQVNVEAANRARLQISSKLLSLAQIVGTQNTGR